MTIVTGAIDDCLDARRYILPGLGDFGDRLWVFSVVVFGRCVERIITIGRFVVRETLILIPLGIA